MEFLLSVLAGACVLLLFGLAIFIHEFGHFLAARWMGLQVDAFAIGFGPALWKRTVNGVEYKIGCIPFGGYVALPQLDPSGMEKVQGGNGEASRDDLPDIAAWRRIVVAVAGPFGNMVLAVALALCIAWMPGVRTGALDTRIGLVEEGTAAWEAGLRTGDRIESVNGHKVSTWTDMEVEWQLAGGSGEATFGGYGRAPGPLELDLELGPSLMPVAPRGLIGQDFHDREPSTELTIERSATARPPLAAARTAPGVAVAAADLRSEAKTAPGRQATDS